MFTLENQELLVQINPIGAELTHVIDQKSGFDFIWNDERWPKHAPILFPAIGRSTKDQYLIDGKAYPMQQHGFAADYEFQVINDEHDTLTLELKANDQTRKSYPFAFNFHVSYHLSGKNLSVVFKVTNQDQKELSFSLGFHPAFNLPEAFEDYRLAFSPGNQILKQFEIVKNPFPYRSGSLKTAGKVVSELQLTRPFFEEGLVILENDIESVKLSSNSSSYAIKVNMEDFPYLCLWTKEDMDLPYLCIEPFQGLPDIIDQEQELLEKEGNVKLAAGKSADYQVQLTFEN